MSPGLRIGAATAEVSQAPDPVPFTEDPEWQHSTHLEHRLDGFAIQGLMNGLVRIQPDKRRQDIGIDGQQGLDVLFAVGKVQVVAAETEDAPFAQLLDEVALEQPAGMVGESPMSRKLQLG